MPDRRQLGLQVRIGVFVLASLAVFVGLIYMLGAEGRYFERKYELVAEYTEVGGLIAGATVRLAGVQVGRVKSVALPERPGGKVKVTLTVARRFSERIRKNSVARIETHGLLGDKIIEISLGTHEAPPLASGETIATRDPVELNRLAGEGVEIMKNVSALSSDLRTTVDAFNKSRSVEDLSAALKSARRIAEEVERGQGWLHALIYEEPEALRKLNDLLTATHKLVTQGQKGESAVSVLLSAESGRAARHLLQAMESFGKLAEKVNEGEGFLQALLFDPQFKPVAQDLQALARNFREVSERLAGGKGVLGGLLREEGEGPWGSAAVDFKTALANLRAITDRLASGEGTIGGLIEDPTVYENLAAFLEGAQRSFLLRSLIRSTISAGREHK
jgi:phospholipid/cholesterol/gamma-HCH transport system substrate-binding protein